MRMRRLVLPSRLLHHLARVVPIRVIQLLVLHHMAPCQNECAEGKDERS